MRVAIVLHSAQRHAGCCPTRRTLDLGAVAGRLEDLDLVFALGVCAESAPLLQRLMPR